MCSASPFLVVVVLVFDSVILVLSPAHICGSVREVQGCGCLKNRRGTADAAVAAVEKLTKNKLN